MKSSRPRHALIGAGGFGRRHLETLRSLSRSGHVEMVAVCDPALFRLDGLADELAAGGVRLYEDHVDLLEREDTLDSVTVAAPIPFHHRIAADCLRRPLFVYLEKPPVPLLGQWKNLLDRDAASRVAVGFQLVESGWSRSVKTALTNGILGDLREVRVRASWPRGDTYYGRASWAGKLLLGNEPVFDGPATNALAHLIHQIQFFAGATAKTFAVPETIRAWLYRCRRMEAYDTAFVEGRFSRGVRFRAALSHASHRAEPYAIRVIGSAGWVEISESAGITGSRPVLPGGASQDNDPFDGAYRTFFDFVRGRSDRPSTLLRDTLGYLATTNGMLVSSGGIQDVPAAWVSREAASGFHSVRGLPEVLSGFLETGEVGESEAFAVNHPPDVIRVADLRAGDGPVRDCLCREAGRAAAIRL